MKRSLPVVAGLLLLLPTLCYPQAPVRKFPQIINRPNNNAVAPFISMDGNTLVYTSDFTNDREYAVFYSLRQNVNWQEPRMLPRHLNNQLMLGINFTLSPDGKTLYVTSNRSPGLGGYDIWAAPLLSNSPNDLKNLASPINSRAHEGSPTFTPDGNTMYFMRCELMNQQKSDKCKIMMARKSPTGQWLEPEELPGNINTGNSQTPRIGADGETLIFASNAIQPNKGGMDLYLSRLIHNAWSDPVPLEFANTSQDDQFVSLTASGRYLLKDAPGQLKREITEFLIPDELRPKAVMRVEGIAANNAGTPVPAYITVTDIQSNTRLYSGRVDKDGNYFVYLTAGKMYEVSIDPESDNFLFVSKILDLRTDNFPATERLDATLRPVKEGDEFILSGIQFSADARSVIQGQSEVAQLARLIRSSPGLLFDIQIFYASNVQESPGLQPGEVNVYSGQTIITSNTVNTSVEDPEAAAQRETSLSEIQTQTILDALEKLGIKSDQVYTSESLTSQVLPENPQPQVRISVRKK
jgi:hypothetical protein